MHARVNVLKGGGERNGKRESSNPKRRRECQSCRILLQGLYVQAVGTLHHFIMHNVDNVAVAYTLLGTSTSAVGVLDPLEM